MIPRLFLTLSTTLPNPSLHLYDNLKQFLISLHKYTFKITFGGFFNIFISNSSTYFFPTYFDK